MRYLVDLGDMKFGREEDLLVTYALGSCLGLMVYDPVVRVGGLLPLSRINKQKAAINPFIFVDTGVPAMFEAFYELGGQKNQMVVKATGCGNPIGKNEMFNIGERNYTMLKRLLRAKDLVLEAADVGGPNSRTVHFDLSTGKALISRNGKKWEL